MNQEKYSINWHTYSDHLREMLHEMMKSNHLTDVTLVCDDKKQFKAHKIVLSACSPVFKGIIDDLPLDSSVIYLRGIHHQEMESILEFMYLGVATLYEERMNEFLSVAKNLEIKEINKGVEFDKETVEIDQPELNYNKDGFELKSEQPCSTNAKNYSSNRQIKTKNDHSKIQMNADGLFDCGQCQSQFKRKEHLQRHIQSIHEGVKYNCDQCNVEFTQHAHLFIHIKSKHEGVRYDCNQCEYKATQKHHLRSHIQKIHEGVYACDQCNYQLNSKSSLNMHKQSKH